MNHEPSIAVLLATLLLLSPAAAQPTSTHPYLLVLGVAQDGGVPQAGSHDHPGWLDPTERRLVVSVAVVDPVARQRWLFEATPDFRLQLYRLDSAAPRNRAANILDGIFLTHAHIGHYTGLMFLGHESMFIPDIDSWTALDESGTRIEDLIAGVDVAYLDATFFANGEIPGRDMSGFPHPFISTSMERFSGLPAETRSRIRFIHLNHTNPALRNESEARVEIDRRGFAVAEEDEMFEL